MENRSTEVDEYLAGVAPEHREALDKLRELIHEIHPGVSEAIQYKMPAFSLSGEMITSFASRAQYISLYCKPEVVDSYRDDLGSLNVGQGCIRFRKYEQLPLDTVRTIIAKSV